MALAQPEAYLARARAFRPRLFLDGKPVGDLLEHPVTRTVVEANLASYRFALDPDTAPLFVRTSHLSGRPANLYVTLNRSRDDLLSRAAAGLAAAERLGTCIYRCVGADAFNALAATTTEIDAALGTGYRRRLMDFLLEAQDQDLVVGGAMTDPRGPRNAKAKDWSDPDLALRIVERDDQGITVSGAKINISGAYAADWLLVMPSGAKRAGEEDWAVSFAVPNGAPGLTYIAQYTPFSAERINACDIEELGNPRYGQRETAMVVFDRVRIPWERVFMAGEAAYAGKLMARFAQLHRMVCGGSCKVGFGRVLVGAARLIQEWKGMGEVEHVNGQVAEMVTILETVRACATAAAFESKESVRGSGVWLPDDLLGNVAKLAICDGFWRLMALAGDIGGGLQVTAPSLKELDNPETRGLVEKYLGFGTGVPAEDLLRVTRLLQHWTAGMHGVATWHGAGPAQAQRIMVRRLADLEGMKRSALRLAELPVPAGTAERPA